MNALHALATGQADFHHARVVARNGHTLTVASGGRHFNSKRAAGCLLVPEVGDLVLVSTSEHGGYVLAVLEKAPGEQTRELHLQGDTRLRISAGRLQLEGERGVTVEAGDAYEVSANYARFVYGQAYMECASYSASGGVSQQCWEQSREIADEHWRAARREQVDVVDRTVRVCGHDRLDAGSLEHRISEDWSVSAGDASLKARQQVVIDANGQISLG